MGKATAAGAENLYGMDPLLDSGASKQAMTFHQAQTSEDYTWRP